MGFSALLLQFEHNLSGFLQMQSVFPPLKQSDSAKAAFKFDGEFSVVVADFNVVNRKEVVDPSVMKLKQELEHVGRIKFR